MRNVYRHLQNKYNLDNQNCFLDGPEFISNNYKEGRKVISSIESELLDCDEFFISVAFITMSGITPLLLTFKELEKRGISGKILTTDYLSFSEPRALSILQNFKNIEVKMYITHQQQEGFHTKGYIFRHDNSYQMIVGSSNMTLSALTTNKEWNTKITSSLSKEYTKDILNEFNELWHSENSIDYISFIDSYTYLYKERKKIYNNQKNQTQHLSKIKLEPNSMQQGFIDNLKQIYSSGKNKALLISATGTGKTYASAFAMRDLGFKRILFVVHRNQIAKQAKFSYQHVFDQSYSMGLFTGKYQEIDKDFIFATIQTLSKEENIKMLDPSLFDAIIIDEAHHSGANSYQKILNYFKPKLWLGMTATPDKKETPDCASVYEIFDYQIAYEIRLEKALEEDLLCPFHYFGIKDLEVVNDDGTNLSNKIQDFGFLTSDERVQNIIQQASFYGYSGERVKGLIFCSRLDEARELSSKFNEQGWRTLVLSGSDAPTYRENAIERLVGKETSNALDYIISVDIFSEGVDIPEINQVIMLRPTQSPIVFIQQLGRGLRKHCDKEYVVILDFIGNYQNNFMIPIALSGDRTYNKDNIRHYVFEGERIIPGSSTIHFDEVSRKRILESIDKANFSDIRLIKENYISLKNKLGRIPSLCDFDQYGQMDILRIFENDRLGSYHMFLKKYEKDYKIQLTPSQEEVIKFVSTKLANGKRVHELELLNCLFTSPYNVIEHLKTKLENQYNYKTDENCIQNIINVMTNKFPINTYQKNYSNCVFIEKIGQQYCISQSYQKMLEDSNFTYLIKELINFGLSRFLKYYRNGDLNTNLVLYQKYTYEDVCRLLHWKKNEVPLNIGGYKYDKDTKSFPVFINYEKSDNIAHTIKYEDHFIQMNRLIAISKGGRSMESEDVQNFIHSKKRGISVHLFVRKNKNDKISKEFYYLGTMEASNNIKEITLANTNKKAVAIEWILDHPVREDIYHYIVKG